MALHVLRFTENEENGRVAFIVPHSQGVVIRDREGNHIGKDVLIEDVLEGVVKNIMAEVIPEILVAADVGHVENIKGVVVQNIGTGV